jgi:hypothetical protein
MPNEDFELEGIDEEDEAEDIGAAKTGSTRYDPSVLYYRVSSTDWRSDTQTNADGLQRPAVQQGRINFLDAAPGIALLSNWKEGGKAPYTFTAHRLAIRLFLPVMPSDKTGLVAAGAQVTFNPRGIQIAQLLSRGLFSMNADNVPIFQRVPVDAIGAAGGMIILGGADSATGQNMGTSRRDGFPLPDPLELRTGGPAIEAFIELDPLTVAALGQGPGNGYGMPLPQDAITITNPVPPPAETAVALDAPRIMISFELWGRRGLNIAAGTKRIVAAARAVRR